MSFKDSVKNFKDSIKRIEKKIQFQPVKGSKHLLQKEDYIVNKWIVKSAILIIGIFFVWIAWHDFGFDYKPEIFFRCDSPQGCSNPFYEGCYYHNIQCSGVLCSTPKYKEALFDLCMQPWSNDEVLPNGFQYGKAPSPFFQYKEVIAFAILVTAFLINHFIYNRRTK